MNYTISVLFRAIPVIMAAICLGLGILIWQSGTSIGDFIAGHVTTFLAAICICLFSTASVIILQLIGKFHLADKWIYPGLGYIAAIITFSYGVWLFNSSNEPQYFVAGHVIAGLGLICTCISTVALASTKFLYIPKNSHRKAGDVNHEPPAFSKLVEVILLAIPVIMAATGWIWGLSLLAHENSPPHFIAGHVLCGLSAICTCLISLVWAVTRQIQNTHGERERLFWPTVVVIMGLLCIAWGISLLVVQDDRTIYFPPGFVLIGLGLVCFSILSKVSLLALVWRREFEFANRIPLIPVSTALACLFLAAFLFQLSVTYAYVFIPARVIVGLGAICFSLFSIVSILESGTSKK